MRISDWSSDVCSSDLVTNGNRLFPKRVTAVLDLIDERLGIRLKVRRSLLDGLNIDAIDGLGQESGHAGGCDGANGAQAEKSHRSLLHSTPQLRLPQTR